MPLNVTANLIKDTGVGGCTIQLGWSPPISIAFEAATYVSHYIVYVNGIDVINKTRETDQNLTLISYPVCSCGAHVVSVSAVNLCGCESQMSPNVTLDKEPVPALLPECEDATLATSDQGESPDCTLLS